MFTLIITLCLNSYALDTTQLDKRRHIAASAMITTAVYATARYNDVDRTEAFLLAATTTIMIGVLKEMTDDTYDNQDIDADGLGIIIMLPIIAF